MIICHGSQAGKLISFLARDGRDRYPSDAASRNDQSLSSRIYSPLRSESVPLGALGAGHDTFDQGFGDLMICPRLKGRLGPFECGVFFNLGPGMDFGVPNTKLLSYG